VIAFTGAEFLRMTEKELVRNFTKAGVYFVSKVRGYLNTDQPYTRSPGGKHRGLDPSRPGGYPKKLSGQLQRSVTWKVDAGKKVLTVGSNLEGYPSFLITGTRFMAPRPWLPLAWDAEKDNVGRIILGKK
jgi:hypothetical protein